MNKQELIKKYEGEFPSIGMNLSTAIKFKKLWIDILELDEQQKQVVPQFVADWIEKVGNELFGLNYDGVPSEIYDWVYEEKGNLKKLHLACAIGYTVEEEKRYLVKMKGINKLFCFLSFQFETNSWIFDSYRNTEYVRTHHTRKELEEAGFGWVFDCPRMEVEEVE